MRAPGALVSVRAVSGARRVNPGITTGWRILTQLSAEAGVKAWIFRIAIRLLLGCRRELSFNRSSSLSHGVPAISGFFNLTC